MAWKALLLGAVMMMLQQKAAFAASPNIPLTPEPAVLLCSHEKHGHALFTRGVLCAAGLSARLHGRRRDVSAAVWPV